MVYPLIIKEVPHACSATSSPLMTSPIESGVVLPCYWVMISARTLWSLFKRATKSNMYLWRAGIMVNFTKKRSFWPSLEGFFWVFDDGIELLLTGLWDPSEEFLGDWIFNWESFSVFGFNEFTINKVFVDSGESVSVELSKQWHKFQLVIKIRIARFITSQNLYSPQIIKVIEQKQINL